MKIFKTTLVSEMTKSHVDEQSQKIAMKQLESMDKIDAYVTKAIPVALPVAAPVFAAPVEVVAPAMSVATPLVGPTSVPGFDEELKKSLKAQDDAASQKDQEENEKEMAELTKEYNEMNSKFNEDIDAFSKTLKNQHINDALVQL